MKAFLIDPFTRTITEVEYDGSLEHMYQLIGCDSVEAVKLTDSGDCVWVDEEGLLKNPTHFFYIGNYPGELAGKGLVLGTDGGGNTVPCATITLPLLLRSVAYMNMQKGEYVAPPIIVTLMDKAL